MARLTTLPTINLAQGDTLSQKVSIMANNVLLDLRGFTFFLTVKTDYDDEINDLTALLKITSIIANDEY